MKLETSPDTHTRPRVRSRIRRAELTRSDTGRTSRLRAMPAPFCGRASKSPGRNATFPTIGRVGRKPAAVSRSMAAPMHGQRRCKNTSVQDKHSHPITVSARTRRRKLAGRGAGDLSEHNANPLKLNMNKSVRNWARQRILWPGHHLAFESTRYAHFYPQDLWTTLSRSAQPWAGKPCVAWHCGCPPGRTLRRGQ